jgi:hypothetical protein
MKISSEKSGCQGKRNKLKKTAAKNDRKTKENKNEGLDLENRKNLA